MSDVKKNAVNEALQLPLGAEIQAAGDRSEDYFLSL